MHFLPTALKLRQPLPEQSIMPKSRSRIPAVLPFGIKNRMQTELPALVALTAIGEPWFCDVHQNDLLAVALVVSELAEPSSLQAESAFALQRLCEDPITLEQKADVALHLAECLPWLQLQTNPRIQRALQAITARCYRLAA